MKYTEEYYLTLLKALHEYLVSKKARLDGFTAFDFSNTVGAYKNYTEFYDKVSNQKVYENELTQNLFKSLHEYLSPIKTIASNISKLSDINYINNEQVNRLLESFGCTKYGCLTSRQRRELLLVLVDIYKHKGTTLSAQNILNLFSETYHIHEVFYKKHNSPYDFIYYTITDGIPGIKPYLEEHTVKKELILDDPRWFLTDDQLQNYETNKAITPYLVITNDIHITSNIATITILRTLALNDYTVLQQHGKDSDEYNNTRKIHIEELPQNINYLELYYLIQYLYIILNNLQNIQGTVFEHTYGYTPPSDSTDIIINEIDRQFKTRYTDPNKTATSITTIRTWKEKIRTLYLSETPFQSCIQSFTVDLKNYSYTTVRDKLIIVGGLNSDNTYNNKVFIYSLHDPSISIVLENFPKQSEFPIVVPDNNGNQVLITGGVKDNSPELSSYVINLNDLSIHRVSDLPEEWNFNQPLVIANSNHSLVASIDYNDKYNGFIYQWSVGNQNKQLVAALNPDDYDITTLRGVAASNNLYYLIVKSRKYDAYRILYFNIDKGILADITCPLLSQCDFRIKSKLIQKLTDGDIHILPAGRYLRVGYVDGDNIEFITIEQTEIIGEYKTYIQPRSISPFLLPLYGNYVKADDKNTAFICLKDYNNLCATFEIDSNFRTTIVSSNNAHNKTFLSIFHEDEHVEIDYWPVYLDVFTYKAQQNPSIQTNIPYKLSDITLDSSFRTDIEGHQSKYGFPNYYIVDFDRYKQTINNQHVSVYSFIPNLPLHSNYANRFFDYDSSFFYDKESKTKYTPFYSLNETYSNNYYCYMLYDGNYIYDIQCKLTFVSYITLPLSSDTYRNQLSPMYIEQEHPDKIEIRFSAYASVLYKHLLGISDNRINSSYHYYVGVKDNNVYIYKPYPYVIKRQPKDYTLSYDDSQTLRHKRHNLLDERVNKIEQGQIPQFTKFSDLSEYLENLTSQNKLYIDGLNKNNKQAILCDLISQVNSLYDGANLYTISSSINNCITETTLKFTPVHSRLLPIVDRAYIHDPVGDWIAIADSFEYFNIKKLVDNLTIYDNIQFNTTKQYNDSIQVNDKYSLVAKPSVKDTLSIVDKMGFVIKQEFTEHIEVQDGFAITASRRYKYDTGTKYDVSPIIHYEQNVP